MHLLAIYLTFLFVFPFQYSWSLWIILEGTWFYEEFMEAQARVEGWGCWHCCFVWAGVLCLVLCRWDCWKGIYIHWLLSLRTTSWNVFQGIDDVSFGCHSRDWITGTSKFLFFCEIFEAEKSVSYCDSLNNFTCEVAEDLAIVSSLLLKVTATHEWW